MFRLLLISCAAYTTIRLFSLFGTRNADGRTLCIGYYTVYVQYVGGPLPPLPHLIDGIKHFYWGKYWHARFVSHTVDLGRILYW